MADFLTRLAGRALGVTPVVQPLITPMFAPEPTDHPLEVEWNGEETTSPGDPGRVPAYSARDVPPVWSAPTDPPHDAAMIQRGNTGDVHQEDRGRSRRVPESQPEPSDLIEPAATGRETLTTHEDRQNSPSATRSQPQRATGSRPESRRVAETGSLEHRSGPKEENRQNLSQDPPSRSQKTPGGPEPSDLIEPAAAERETLAAQGHRQNSPSATRNRPQRAAGRPEPPHPVDSDPIRRAEAASESPQALHADAPSTLATAESASVRAVPDRVRTLVERVRDATLPSRPSPSARILLDVQESIVESQTLPDRLALPGTPLVKPEMVRAQLNGDVGRAPQEPRESAPEHHAPTIRVNIGRIEVRAITPPPPPVRRPAPARPGPALSLDAYLKQRDEGQR